ncbi:MAG TPA: hypothetical protein VJR92_15215 [Gemmatimonadaceae bacterium]|nr:hypothetical protein [Gemmatimonadaceae bacterium]
MSAPAALVAQASAAQAPTFGAVLSEARVNTRFLDSAELKRAFSSGTIENAPYAFFAAFYDVTGSALPDTLRVYALDKLTREWTVAALPRKQRVERDTAFELGAVMRIRHTTSQIYIDTHISPSAGAILVLARQDLRVRKTLYGWSLALLADEVLLYHRSMVHFAPTHSAELWRYDPRTGSDSKLVPLRPPESIRERYVRLVRTIWSNIGEDWFRKNNHHMDPERFDNVLRDSIVVSESGRTFAGIFVWGGGIGTAKTPLVEIALHCRAPEGAPFRCIEEELSAARQRALGLSDYELLLWLVRT